MRPKDLSMWTARRFELNWSQIGCAISFSFVCVALNNSLGISLYLWLSEFSWLIINYRREAELRANCDGPVVATRLWAVLTSNYVIVHWQHLRSTWSLSEHRVLSSKSQHRFAFAINFASFRWLFTISYCLNITFLALLNCCVSYLPINRCAASCFVYFNLIFEIAAMKWAIRGDRKKLHRGQRVYECLTPTATKFAFIKGKWL